MSEHGKEEDREKARRASPAQKQEAPEEALGSR